MNALLGLVRHAWRRLHRLPFRCGAPLRDWPQFAHIEIDKWVERGNGVCSTCSFCGSLHPQDAQRLLKTEGVVEPTRLSFKFFVKSPRLVNPEPAGWKVYGWHTPTRKDNAAWWALVDQRFGEAIERIAAAMPRQKKPDG